MRYEKIRKYDVANAPGIRTTIFCTGCEHFCKGCFNEKLWDFNKGELFTAETMDILMSYLSDKEVVGMNILGGEPAHPKNISTITKIVRTAKELYPNKTIWLWSGYRLEELKLREDAKELLSLIDVIVDGKFELENRDINLKYRGSSNQRVIKLK